jgi:membrane-associated protein
VIAATDPSPTDARRRRAEVACVAGVAASGVYGLVTLFVSPSLLGTRPVLLELLRGSVAAMVAGGAFARVGEASLVLAILAPLPTLLVFDPFLWWAGRLWGPRVAHMLTGRGARARRWTDRASAWTERYGGWAIVLAYFLPVPSALIYAAAGWSGMRLRRFVALDLCGALLWVALNVGLGYAIGQGAVSVAKTISHDALIITLVIVAVVVVVSARRAIREGPEPASEPRAEG